MKKFISLLISCIMVLQMCLVLPDFAVFAEDGTAPEPKILLNEDYTTDAEGSAFFNREALGWTQEPTEYGKNPYAATSFDSGLKLHQTGNKQYVNSLFRKKFIVTESGNDDYMKVRRVNFKGIYDVELNLAIKRDGSYRRNIIFNGGVSAVEKNIFNYGDSWGKGINQGFYKNFDSRWSGVTNNYTAGNATVTATYKTRFDFINDTAYLFYNGSSTPSNYTGSDKVVTSSGDAAPMTSGADYLSSVDFLFDYRNTANPIVVKNVKLIEVEKTADVTDTVISKLNSGVLTGVSNSNVVRNSLNLPTAASLGVEGAEIEWTSSDTNIISNDGSVVSSPEESADVVITAKITNTSDNFTQYVDFNLVVPSSGTVLLNEDYTTDAEGSAFANREALGWSVEPTQYGVNKYATMSFDSGLKLHQTGNQQYVYPLFRRKFTVTENGNDDYMKIRRVNFKGIYDLEVKMTMTNDGSYKRNIIFNGGVNSTEKNVFNYGDAWGSSINQGFYKIFDARWDAGVYQNWGAQTATFNTHFDFTNDSAQLIFDGTPANYTGNDKISTPSGNVAPLTSGADYLSSVDFLFDYRNTTKPITINSLKLTEIEKTADVTDAVVASLNTNLLTGGTNIITNTLNLPVDFAGATVTWSANGSEFVSDEGKILAVPSANTNVKLTAKITNNQDGFTQYADFDLILSSDATKTPAIDNVNLSGNKLRFTLLNNTGSAINASNVPFVAAATYTSSKDEITDVSVIDWASVAAKYPELITDGVAHGKSIEVELIFNTNVSGNYKIFLWENASTLKPISLYVSK